MNNTMGPSKRMQNAKSLLGKRTLRGAILLLYPSNGAYGVHESPGSFGSLIIYQCHLQLTCWPKTNGHAHSKNVE